MIIRSQNKKELHNLEKISMIKVVTNSQEYFVEVNSQHTIGTYSTEEKAIKVLDMIMEHYDKAMDARYWNDTYQENYFIMPKDEDVEV